jgi:hypothetical protein
MEEKTGGMLHENDNFVCNSLIGAQKDLTKGKQPATELSLVSYGKGP